ncbi:PREDICTED: protein GDAP2 homolog [Papilio xuthus]|uniref:Protein GDAP2 homolog n=1 Tax=Papilio xuthus TaxID=66420 RepID=A0AAJ7EC94_PAPXU|nr:PREDICTED: protein GDAP2 homolog [Papilio xuthus]XP_013171528.1 PREDICTED: protein GDAP2 homolog [Papilio xuthus]
MRAPSGVVRWSQSGGAPLTDYAAVSPAPAASPPPLQYIYDERINQRLAFWQGDITALDVDAVTNTTDETLSECNAVSERIMHAAGPELKEEIITRGLECGTGEVVVTPGYQLRSRHVLHTVCPNYLPQYHTAAETSLHNCYKNVLSAACEVGARSLALCVVSTPRRNFPPDLAAHVALSTIRRYLETSAVPGVVVVCACGVELSPLRALAPLYFPRSAREALAAAARLPPPRADLHDRRIRIIHNPHSNSDSAEDDASACDSDAAAEAAAAFARACAPDTQRLLAPHSPHTPHTPRRIHDHDEYERLLRRARSEDLSEISGIGCLYQSGVDRLGRPVVVFIGKWFPIGDIDLDKAMLYLIKLLEPIVRGDYVIAYFHTLASSANHPPFSWLKEVYTVLPYKYKKNLKAFYIVHPTFWTKMMTWWFTTFMAPAIKAKVHSLPGVEYLYSVMARDQLEVPAFVTEYDMTINGLHYFQPDTSST